MLLYLFVAIALASPPRTRDASGSMGTEVVSRFARAVLCLLVLFSAAYVSGMMWWGFWTWSSNSLDILNALLLPFLLFLAGLKAALLPRSWSTCIFLAYALGGLLYGVAALAVAREPWWNLLQGFPLSIDVAWGSPSAINVRSVEQTSYPALLLLAPALMMVATGCSVAQRNLGVLFIGISCIAAHVVWSLNGRLGWLALLLAVAPIVFRRCLVGGGLWLGCFPRASVAAVASAVLLSVIVTFAGIVSGKYVQSVGWSQGLCDERMSFFGAMLIRLPWAPWGGRILQVPYSLCGSESTHGLLAAKGGTVTMAHNVILEIYFSVGLLPSLLLLAAVSLPLLRILRGFASLWAQWDWQVAIWWGWLCFLVCQWTFQPLLYSDGLLYYFSFFVMGLFVVAAPAGFPSHGCKIGVLGVLPKAKSL